MMPVMTLSLCKFSFVYYRGHRSSFVVFLFLLYIINYKILLVPTHQSHEAVFLRKTQRVTS